jgi:molybdopterin molybdotransferase
MAMISFDEARTRLQAGATPITDVCELPLAECYGRVLAADLASPFDVPGFDNSAMDGYALRLADLAAAAGKLPVRQRIAAGMAPEALQPGAAARIFTGAALPSGADAIVMQENCRVEGDYVIVEQAPKSGQFIRRQGHEIRAGATVLTAGSRLGAAHLGLAASLGLAALPVFRRLRVAIFFTGSELVPPGAPLRPGQIYNSNRFVMQGLLRGIDAEIVDLGIVRDDLGATREALRKAAADADVILTSGGMSVGEEDHVKAAVEAEGELTTWKIAVKPGKPVAFGRVGKAAFVGLPGNPVSVWVAFITLVLPYLKMRQGITDAEPVRRQLTADFAWRTGERREFVRVRRNAIGRLELHPNQDSGALSSTVWADGLADVPPQTQVNSGDPVAYWPAPGFSA